jgi:uncharacterized protein YbaR (Trm112 family)
MPADSTRPSSGFDPSVLNQLACPVCLGDLFLMRAELICAKCKRAYPILERIPALVADRKNPQD